MFALQLYDGHNPGARSEEELLSSAATELVHLQAALGPKHVDNFEHAVAEGDGPQIIRELIDVCGALSNDSNVVGRQTAAEGMRRPPLGVLPERRSRQRL